MWPVPTRLYGLNVTCCPPPSGIGPTGQESLRLCDSLTVLVHSRAILQDVLDADLSNEAFPFSTHQLVRAAGHLVGSNGRRPLGSGVWWQQLLAKVGWAWESGTSGQVFLSPWAQLAVPVRDDGSQADPGGSSEGHDGIKMCVMCFPLGAWHVLVSSGKSLHCLHRCLCVLF